MSDSNLMVMKCACFIGMMTCGVGVIINDLLVKKDPVSEKQPEVGNLAENPSECNKPVDLNMTGLLSLTSNTTSETEAPVETPAILTNSLFYDKGFKWNDVSPHSGAFFWDRDAAGGLGKEIFRQSVSDISLIRKYDGLKFESCIRALCNVVSELVELEEERAKVSGPKKKQVDNKTSKKRKKK